MKFKSIIILLFVIFSFNSSFAQSISLNYNSVHIGRNISVLYNHSLNRHQIYGGLKYHVNTIVRDNQGYIFKKRFHAYSFQEHIGLQFGYNYNIPLKNENELFGFYDNQFTIAGTRGVVSIKYPFKAMEHNVGIGLLAGLFDNLFATFRIGGGIVHYWDIPSEIAPNEYLLRNNPYTWEFGGIISAGLEYKL